MQQAPGADPAAPAPADCVASWNGNEAARSYARHNLTFHRYTEAQVGYLAPDGSSTIVSRNRGDGECVVVFPRAELDPEPEAAGQIEHDGGWLPLSEIMEPIALAELQAEALAAANVRPTEQGELEPH